LFQSFLKTSYDKNALTIFKDGSGMFSRLQYLSGYTCNVIYGKFQNGSITRERVIPYRGAGVGAPYNFLQLNNSSQLIVRSYADSLSGKNGLELLKLNDADIPGDCFGYDTTITQVIQQQYLPYHSFTDSIRSDGVVETTLPFQGIVDKAINKLSSCTQVSFCDTLKLQALLDTLCLSTPLVIAVKKNNECGSVIAWSYDTAAIRSFTKINDSTVKVFFKIAGQGYIYARINTGSIILADSVKYIVKQSPQSLYLGNDTVVCLGDSLQLTAGKYFSSYFWQDGSVDSIYTVRLGGKYYVTTTDGCGTVFSDTININGIATNFNLGNDTALCNGQNLFLSSTIPGSNVSYLWQDNSIGNSYLVSQAGQYWLTINNTGCIAADTIVVSYKNNPVVNLGNDTTLCTGQTLVLNAFNTSASYIWQDSSMQSTYSVSAPGTYYVKVSVNGCNTNGQLNVKYLSPPIINLGADTSLCTTALSLLLEASFPYSSYLWQDGSVQPTYNVVKDGSYSVAVTNVCGTSNDEIHIQYKNCDCEVNPTNAFTQMETATMMYGLYTKKGAFKNWN
jgi:hypothetical protein